MQALLIPGDYKEVANVPFKGSLEEVQRLFQCQTIEVVPTPIPTLFMLVDEDARLKGMAINHKATLFHPRAIFGPALLTYGRIVYEGSEAQDLEFTGIPPKFDFHTVAESSYQRIVASLGEHPVVTLGDE